MQLCQGTMKSTGWPYNREVHFHSSIVLGSRPVASVFVRKDPLYLYRRYYRYGLEIQRDDRLRRPTLCPEPWRVKSQDPDGHVLDRSRIVPANEAVPILRTSMGSLLRPWSFQIIVGHEVRIIVELALGEPYRNLLLEMVMEGARLAMANTVGKNRCYLTRCKSNVYHDFYIYYYYKLGEKRQERCPVSWRIANNTLDMTFLIAKYFGVGSPASVNGAS